MENPRGRDTWFGKLVFYSSVGSVLLAFGLLAAGYALYKREFPDVTVLKRSYPLVSYQGPSSPPKVRLQPARPAGWVPLNEVSKVAVGAVIVSEDWAFFQHKGYDANQMMEALKEDFEAGRFLRGASTITQQVVRNVFLDQDKNLWRKIREIYLATKLEEVVPKRKILETYLNIAEWGEGIYGIREASRDYFHKPPAELTAKEGAFLAMLLPSPRRYSQSFKARKLSSYAQVTVNSILSKMTQAKYITEEERVREMGSPLVFEFPSNEAL